MHGRALAAATTVVNGVWTITPFTLFLVQLMLIVGISRILVWLLRPLKQPVVVAEIIAGVIIGPTVLGRIPGFRDAVFPKPSVDSLSVVANIGLVLFLFIVGMELDATQLRADLRESLFISFFGISVPLFAALGIAYWLVDIPEYVPPGETVGLLALFLTVILGISALPVLARILGERNMLKTRLGSMSMSVAAIDDVLAWILLAILLALVQSSSSQLGVLWAVLLIFAECLFVFYPVRYIYSYVIRKDIEQGLQSVSSDTFLTIMLVLFATCYLAEIIGLSTLIGAFQVGLVVPRHSFVIHDLGTKIEPLSLAFFMPLYFAFSGLRTDFGLIDSPAAVGVAVALIFVATMSKMIGIVIPARVLKIPWRLSFVLGALMSCKGLIALIVVNYGLSFALITPKFFAILVLMVLVTTVQTVPLVLLIDPPSRAEKSKAELLAWESARNSPLQWSKARVEPHSNVPGNARGIVPAHTPSTHADDAL